VEKSNRQLLKFGTNFEDIIKEASNQLNKKNLTIDIKRNRTIINK
jgi:hypothetical protein